MSRLFKPGTWVRLLGKSRGPKMQVIKYVTKKDLVFGFENSDTYVECVWYEGEHRKSEIFHQDRLIKSIETKGLYRV